MKTLGAILCGIAIVFLLMVPEEFTVGTTISFILTKAMAGFLGWLGFKLIGNVNLHEDDLDD